MTDKECDMGIMGAGVMGGNFALNFADHGFSVAVYDVDPARARELSQGKKPEARSGRQEQCRSLRACCTGLGPFC